jgi:hypothetical protein
MHAVLAAQTVLAPALAQQDTALAESLYRDGQRLAREGRCAQARQKFAASLQIERSSGPLIAVGACYEKEGKTASAWASYTEAAAVAAAGHREEHVRVAHTRAAALDGRLCRARIEVAAPVPQMVIVLDGETCPPGLAGTAFPLDPGAHRLEVSAPGHQPWQHVFTLRAEGKTELVPVPPLKAAPGHALAAGDSPSVSRLLVPPAPRREPVPVATASRAVAERPPLRRRGWFWAVVGGAAVGLAVGIAAAAGAFTHEEDVACPPALRLCR